MSEVTSVPALAEGIVGQTDCAKQLRPLGDVFPHLRGLLVHGTLGRNKGHHAAGANLIQSLG